MNNNGYNGVSYIRRDLMVGKAQCDEDQRFFLLTYSINNGRRTSIKTLYMKKPQEQSRSDTCSECGKCVSVCLYVCVCVVVRTFKLCRVRLDIINGI